MKAVLLTRFGGVDALRYGEVPDPMAGRGEVVVDVYAASVNAADTKVRLGQYGDLVLPRVLGRDFSGVVSSVGPEADLKIGDPVFGVTMTQTEGAYAEKIAIDASIVARKPSALSHAAAAAMALAGLTSISALEETAELEAGETILIHGGAGGVGSFAVQLAKDLGAVVIATASSPNHHYVRRLGADRVIDYNEEDFVEVVDACDVVFDTIGGDTQVRSYHVLKPGGRLVWVAHGPDGFVPTRKDVHVLRPRVDRGRSQLERIVELFETGAVSPPEITHYALADVAEAHRVSERGHVRGKLVLDVR